MSGMKIDLKWSPHNPNRFITIGNGIQLYEVSSGKSGNESTSGSVVFKDFWCSGVYSMETTTIEAVPSSEGTIPNVLPTNADHQYLKCVSWYPKPQYPHLLAVGSVQGKAIISSFEENSDLGEFSAREFIPKHARPCNCIAWNPEDCKLLACGLDKNRADYGVLIWDVTRPIYVPMETIHSPFEKRHTFSGVYSTDSTTVTKPAVELGMSESTQSFHWFHHSPNLIVCGTNNKHLKIYDLRDPSKHQNSTPTKAVHAVCVDPYYEHRLASVFENLLVVWDVRNFEKPVATAHEQKPIIKISWCPTRLSFLAALIKDSNAIKLFNIQSSTGNDEIEPTVVERNVQPFDSTPVMSFDWHPTQENRMIVISQNNKLVDYTVFDQVTMNFSARFELAWSHGKNSLQFADCNELGDISVIMYRRALKGYGLKTQQIVVNSYLSEDPNLHGVWVWLDLIRSYRQDKKSRSKSIHKYEGVHTIICGENGSGTISNSEPCESSWIGEDFASCRRTRYVSEERERALQLCGWGSEADSSIFSAFLDRLEHEGAYLRAAAISVFNLDITRAIEILNRGAVSEKEIGVTDLNAVAMALAGYTNEKTALWCKITADLKTRLSDPHLRAMFTFLLEDGNNYDTIMEEDSISIQDKLALALIYLPDAKLAEYLDVLKVKMMQAGNLDGVLLTGLTNDGISLIQNYVDRSADVQTASLIALHTLPSHISENAQVQKWVDAYKELLDRWRLWKQRASFDVLWYKSIAPEKRPRQQVFVSCTFCGKSVSSYLQHSLAPANSSRFPQLAAASPLKTKVTCCPSCRKPLPRCSLCLSRMGTPAGVYWKSAQEKERREPEKKLTNFSNWFTWCQTCRHGGHAVHILSWFEEHIECPVTGCACKCYSLDPIAKVKSNNGE